MAVLRANAVGDFVVTLPALDALRYAYPEAEIVLLGQQWHRDLLWERPGPVDRVEVVPPYPGVSAGHPTTGAEEGGRLAPTPTPSPTSSAGCRRSGSTWASSFTEAAVSRTRSRPG